MIVINNNNNNNNDDSYDGDKQWYKNNKLVSPKNTTFFY